MKWVALPYDQLSWEDQSALLPIQQSKINEFEYRQQQQHINNSPKEKSTRVLCCQRSMKRISNKEEKLYHDLDKDVHNNSKEEGNNINNKESNNNFEISSVIDRRNNYGEHNEKDNQCDRLLMDTIDHDNEDIEEFGGKDSIEFEELKIQPSYIPLRLYPWQLDGLNWLRYSMEKHRNVILADEMGKY